MELIEIINRESVIIEHIFENKTYHKRIYNYEDMVKTIKHFSSFFQREIPDAEIVAVYLPTSFHTYMITLSLIAMGKVVANVFYSYGQSALKTRLEMIEPDFLITTEEKFAVAKNVVNRVITLEKVLLYSEQRSKRSIWKDLKEKDLIALHFTSGTTGMPKVVPHRFRDLMGVYKSFEEVFRPNVGKNYLCTADYGWVTGFYYGIFAPLMWGMNHHIIRDIDGTKVLMFLYHMMGQYHIDLFYTTPLLLKMAYRFFRNHKHVENLRFFSVGEKLPKGIRKKYKELDYRVIDTWWQTELGCITIADIEERGIMGKPILDIETALWKDGEIVEPLDRISGELLIKTSSHPSIMDGYYKNEEASKKKFVGSYYKTGDMVEWIPNEGYAYISRADDVIVIAGELISPDEIESYVLEHFEVLDVAVVQIEEKNVNKIVMFVVGEIDVQDVKKRIFQELSPAMVPDKIIVLDKLPRTESGKIKRNVLQRMIKNGF